MSNMGLAEKIRVFKELLKKIHEGEDVNKLKKEFADVLKQVNPVEIPIIEQELIKEGFRVNDVIALCDLHLELFRDFLVGKELRGVPRGHPLDILIRENDLIMKLSEVLSLHAGALRNADTPDRVREALEGLRKTLADVKGTRVHYRKLQMTIFPYLERRGIYAVPRVLWGKEDEIIQATRKLLKRVEEASPDSLTPEAREEIAKAAEDLSKKLADQVFRENKILYPSLWALLTEGEWAAIKEIGDDIGHLVDPGAEWVPKAKPVMPYEITPEVTPELMKSLPPELRMMVGDKIEPDRYEIRGEGDIELPTGFLRPEEVDALFRALPLEVTYANMDDRIRFFSQSFLHKGFVRTKTIVGRRLEYCHPPRLEYYVKHVVKQLKEGKHPYREFWTRMGGRIIRVLIVPVRDREGKQIGTLEVVEDLTEVVNNPEAIKKKIMVL